MNSYSLTAQRSSVPHPADSSIQLSYHLLPFPVNDGIAWSLLILEETDGLALQTKFLYDLTRTASMAEAIFRLAVEGSVLPQSADEVLLEPTTV